MVKIWVFPYDVEHIFAYTAGLSSTNESEKTKQVRTTITTSWIGQPDAQSTSEIDSIERGMSTI